MKKIPMIILLAAPYLLFIVSIIFSATDGLSGDEMGICIKICLGIIALVFIPNIIYAFLLQKLGYSARKLFFWSMLLKLCYIPIYIAIFLIGCILTISAMGIIYVPFLVIYDYLLLLPSTFYGFSGIVKAAMNPRFGKVGLVICGVLEFFFLADVICSVYLYCRSRCVPETALPQYVPYQHVPYQEVPAYGANNESGSDTGNGNANGQ